MKNEKEERKLITERGIKEIKENIRIRMTKDSVNTGGKSDGRKKQREGKRRRVRRGNMK